MAGEEGVQYGHVHKAYFFKGTNVFSIFNISLNVSSKIVHIMCRSPDARMRTEATKVNR